VKKPCPSRAFFMCRSLRTPGDRGSDFCGAAPLLMGPQNPQNCATLRTNPQGYSGSGATLLGFPDTHRGCSALARVGGAHARTSCRAAVSVRPSRAWAARLPGSTSRTFFRSALARVGGATYSR
jgi:hypothetical protein